MRARLVLLSLAASFFLPTVRGQQTKAEPCKAPRYKIASPYSVNSDQALFAISINPRDVTVSKLLALTCQLRADYPSVSKVHADIFNDERAARCTTVPTMLAMEVSACAKPSSYVATYHLDTNTGVEVLTLVIDSKDPCGKDIKVDLKTRVPSIISCDGQGVPDYLQRSRK